MVGPVFYSVFESHNNSSKQSKCYKCNVKSCFYSVFESYNNSTITVHAINSLGSPVFSLYLNHTIIVQQYSTWNECIGKSCFFTVSESYNNSVTTQCMLLMLVYILCFILYVYHTIIVQQHSTRYKSIGKPCLYSVFES